MDIRRLRYFQKVATLGSINKAAAALNMSQPALSRHMQHLEAHLNAELLERQNSGVMLTSAGRILYNHAGPLLDRLDSICREVRSASPVREVEINFGVPPAVGRLIMGRLIREASRMHPEIRLKVSEATSDNLVEWVLNRQIDFAIVLEPRTSPELLRVPVWSERLFLVGLPDDPIFARAALRIRDLSDLPLCLTGRKVGARRCIEESFRAAGSTLRVTHETESISSVSAMIEATGAYSIMSFAAVRSILDSGALAGLPISDLEVTRHLIWRRDIAATPATGSFRSLVQDLVAAECGRLDWLSLAPAAERRDAQDALSGP